MQENAVVVAAAVVALQQSEANAFDSIVERCRWVHTSHTFTRVRSKTVNRYGYAP